MRSKAEYSKTGKHDLESQSNRKANPKHLHSKSSGFTTQIATCLVAVLMLIAYLHCRNGKEPVAPDRDRVNEKLEQDIGNTVSSSEKGLPKPDFKGGPSFF
jgi:hypothetical protein